MTRGRTLALLGGVLAVGVIAVVIAFFLKKGSSQPTTSPYETAFLARNWRFHLRPITPDKAGDRLVVEQTWRDLFSGMAKDPATRRLLRRLHGDLPVEFVAVDEKAAAEDAVMKAPPSEGFAFAVRVRDLRTYKEKTDSGEVLFRDIAFGHVTYIKDAAVPNAAEGLEEPSPGEALGLAMEDYMLRRAEDWVIGAMTVEKDLMVPAQAAERRADLDHRIQAYSQKASAFYGALRKPK